MWPEMLQNEYKILNQFKHVGCVNLLKCFTTNTSVMFLFEPVLGCYLTDYLLDNGGCLPSSHVRFYVASCLSALNFLHEQSIVYRQLFPDTIMLTEDGKVKLGHFNRAKFLGDDAHEKAYTILGTPAYIAPEMLNRNGYDYSVDVWALGVLTFELYYGESPFDDIDEKLIFNHIILFAKNHQKVCNMK